MALNTDDGNGILWQQFQLKSISQRIDNITNSFNQLQDANESADPQATDLSSVLREVKHLVVGHQETVTNQLQEATDGWTKQLQIKNAEIDRLKHEISVMLAQVSKMRQMKIMKRSINEYVNTKTQHMSQELEDMRQQLDQEKARNSDHERTIAEFISRNQQLNDTLEEMKESEQYDVERIDTKLMLERDDWRNKYDALLVQYNNRRPFKLDDAFSAQLSRLCDRIQSAQSRAIDVEQARAMWQADLKKINEMYAVQLKEKEKAWMQAKDESIKVLDSHYAQLMQQMKSSLDTAAAENQGYRTLLRENAQKVKADETRIQSLNEEVAKLNTAHSALQAKYDLKVEDVISKDRDIVDLNAQLGKYKILWQHFFGVGAEVKGEIENVKQKLAKFEEQHHIQPMPSFAMNKKRKVEVRSMIDWMQFYGFPPLMLEQIPTPDDPYQRLKLRNFSANTIKLKGFCICNAKGQRIVLDENMGISPSGFLTVALKKQKHKSDILASENFEFSFKPNEVLYISDGTQKEQIYPAKRDVHTNLNDFMDSPLQATPFGNVYSSVQGFVIENACGRPITLINAYFTNERGTFGRIPLPAKQIASETKLRLIVVRDDSGFVADAQSDDLIVPIDAINTTVHDKLLLCDKYENVFELYAWNGSNANHNQSQNTNCFIM